MDIIYAREPFPIKITKTLYLADYSTEKPRISTWYQDALDILAQKQYDGSVYVPFIPDGSSFQDFSEQLVWHQTAMDRSDVIVFWIPGDSEQFTTYMTFTEFERRVKGRNVIWGYPRNISRLNVMDELARQYGVPIIHTLSEAVDCALRILGEGAERQGGETHVPLYLWNLPHFQNWLLAQKKVGNSLDDVYSIELKFFVGPKRKPFLLYWGMHVNLFVAAEQRHKSNELVLSRPDIQHIVVYHWPSGKSLDEVEIVLIQEFRSTTTTQDGFIREIPGGSSDAVTEFKEEVGISLEPHRLIEIDSRQLSGTTTAHKAHVFAVHLTAFEMEQIKKQQGHSYGNSAETEVTYPEVYTVKELLKKPHTDWSNLGMILTVLHAMA